MSIRTLLIGCLALAAILLACAEDKTVGPETGTSISVEFAMDAETRAMHSNQVDEVRISLWQDESRVSSRTGHTGDTIRFENIQAGTYTVIAEGLVNSEVDFFGNRVNVNATEGRNTTVNITNYASFRPTLSSLGSSTTEVQFDVSYGGISLATGYTVEWGTGGSFSNSMSIPGTSARISVEDPGFCKVRVRASNQWVTPGRASEPDSIEVVVDTSGETSADAIDLGTGEDANGRYDGLNILPSTDRDWFALALNPGDRLTVMVYTSSLGNPSDLDPVLGLYLNPAGSPIAEDNSHGEADLDSILIATAATYYLRVSGQVASAAASVDSVGTGNAPAAPQATGEVGHYELVVLVESSSASASTTEISASPTSIPADGSATSAVTVQVKDSNGNNLTAGGDFVELATTAGALSSVTDNGDGTYSATLTAGMTPDTATITGTLNSVPMSDDATVQFTSRMPDPSSSTISAAPTSIPADGTSTSTITVQLKDANGVNLTTGGHAVALSSTAGTLSVVTDNNNGTYTATLTSSSTAGTALITGTLNSVAITDDATVLFSAVPLPSPATSTISASPSVIPADGSSISTITIQLKYADGDNLTSGGHSVELSTTAGTLGAISDNGDGTYTATLTASTSAATATITGTLNGVAMADDATVAFAAITADPTTSTITAVPTAITADGTSTSTITVRLKDAGGANLTTGGDNVELATTAGAFSVVTDHNDGTYTATLTSSTTAETATITGTLNSVAMTDTATVTFTTGPLPDPTTSTITASPESIPADGSSTSTITVQLKYSNGSNLTTGGDDVELSTTAGTLSVVTDNNDGTYSATLTAATNASIATISGRLNGVSMTDSASVIFTSLVHSVVVTPAGASISGIGTKQLLTAEARDAGGSPLPSATITWTSLNPNVATIDASTGEASAVASGQVTVRAEADGVVGYGLLTVSDLFPPSVPIASWAPQDLGKTNYSIGVWGTSPSDVWVVGGVGILHYDGAAWEQISQDYHPSKVWGTSPADVWAADGTYGVLHYDGTEWAQHSGETTENLRSVWGTSPEDVFAVGYDGAILHYDGSEWAPQASGTSDTLSSVWGTSPADVFAVGYNGTVLHYDGTTWTEQYSGTTTLLADVWGTSPTDVYATGGNGTILHYDGSEWVAQASGTSSPLLGIWGSGATNIFAVGGATILRYDGASWVPQASGTTSQLDDIWGASPTDVFIVGWNGTILHGSAASPLMSTITASPANIPADGSSTTTVTLQSKNATGVNVTTAGDAVTLTTDLGMLSQVTDNGDGTYSATLTAGTSVGAATVGGTLNGVALSNSGTVGFMPTSLTVAPSRANISVAGGTQAFTARDQNGVPFEDVTWTSLNPNVATIDASTGVATAVASGQTTISAAADGLTAYALLTVTVPVGSAPNIWSTTVSASGNPMNDVWGASGSDIFVVGWTRTILHYDGTVWDTTELGDGFPFLDVWGTSATDVFAVGASGWVRHYDGTGWSAMESGTNQHLEGVWGASPMDVFAVGASGTILHFDGTTWSNLTSGTTDDLCCVWGMSSDDVYAAGNVGVLHYDGSAWSEMPSAAGYSVWGLWGTSSDDIYAVCDASIIHYDGTSWSQVWQTGASDVWGTHSTHVYAVGWNRTILHYDGVSWDSLYGEPSQPFRGVWGTSATDVYVVDGSDGTILRGHRGATVSVTPASSNLTAIDETVQLSAAAQDASSSPITGVTFTWSSDNQSVATVSATGLVTASGFGTAMITATAPGGAADTATISVVPAADSVAVSPIGASISGVDATYQFTVEAWDANGNPIASPAATWTSLNPDVATIDQNGLATALRDGQVTIRAQVDGVVDYALLTVAVPDAIPVNLWNVAASGAAQHFIDIWGASADNIFAVGGSGTIHRYDGIDWTAMTTGTGEVLRGIWGTSASDVFAVGANGTVIRFDGSSWHPMTTGFTVTFDDVWGSSPDDLYAAGLDGSIVHYDGSTWSAMTTGTAANLHGIWGTSPNDIFAVGDGGVALHYDGSDWSGTTTGTTQGLSEVWGIASSDVYAVGGYGTILHYDGSSWNAQTSGTTLSLGGVWGSSTDDIYAAGTEGTIFYHDGSSWSTQTSGVFEYVSELWGTWSSDVYATSQWLTVLRGYRGATVTIPNSDTTLTAIDHQVQLSAFAEDAGSNPISVVSFTWSSSDSSVALPDDNGLVTAVANGTATITATAPGGASGTVAVTVQQVAASVTVDTEGVTISGIGSSWNFDMEARDSNGYLIPFPIGTWSTLNTDVATIDQSGIVTAQRDGQVTVQAQVDDAVGYALLTVTVPEATPVNLWNSEPSGTTQLLRGVWGSAPNDVYAVGHTGTIRHYDGSGWTTSSSGTAEHLRAVWGTSWDNVYAVGENGTIRHYTGGTGWDPIVSGTSEMLLGVWGSAPNDVYVGIENGTMLHYDGSDWSFLAASEAMGKRIWGSSSSDVFAVVTTDTIVHYDGTSWSFMQIEGIPNSLYALWGSSPSEVYAAAGPRVYSYDGTNWTRVLNTSDVIFGIWGSSSTEFYAVGQAGAILHYDGLDWETQTSGTTVDLERVWGTSPGVVFAVGYSGTILHGYRGATVTVAPTDPVLTAIGAQVQLTASAEDASTNPIDGVTYAWSSSDSTVAIPDAAGLVTAIANGSATIVATAPGGAAGSVSVTVSQVPKQLVIASQPDNATAGVSFTPAIRVEVRDSLDNIVTAATNDVTVALTDETALRQVNGADTTITLSGTTTKAAEDGVATFDAVWIEFAAGAYQIEVSAPGVASDTSSGIDILPGPPAQLAFTVQPTETPALAAITPAVEVSLQDLFGNPVPTSGEEVIIDITGGSGPTGGVLIGGPQSEYTNPMGVAVFDDLRIDVDAAGYTLDAVSGMLIPATSDAFTVLPVQAESVTVSPAGAFSSGGNVQFTATAYDPLGGVISSPSVSWTSLNTDVATVDFGGLATPQRDGQVTIRAQVDDAIGYALLTVNDPSADPVSLWTSMNSGTTEHLYGGVWGASSNAAFAVGQNATIRRFDGTDWGAMSGAIGDLYGVWGTSPNDLFAVGSIGRIYHYDGDSWSAQGSGTTEGLYGVWGSSPNDVYAVGTTGKILHYDGNNWSAQGSGTTQPLRGVWGTSSTDVYAVGDIGTILHYDGSTWGSVTSGTSERLWSVWGTSPTDVYAVGAAGTVRYYDPVSWVSQASGTTEVLWGVWGTSSNDVYAVGASGRILHYGGSNWSSQASGAAGNFYGVWGTSATDAYAVGVAGTIWRGIRGATVTVTPSSAVLTVVGDQLQLSVVAEDAGGSSIGGVSYVWSSSDSSVAVPSAGGVVAAFGVGTATISATAPGGASGTTSITVGDAAWTWFSGDSLAEQAGVYGVKGIPDASNVPGARDSPVSWIDASGNLWLFGGYGRDNGGGTGQLNDLWRFDGAAWTWISGSASASQSGTYGIKGAPSSSNVPGARYLSVSWIDGSGNLWLFGGYGRDSENSLGDLNDLWRFDGTNWTWISGSATIGQKGTYGTQGMPNVSNVPGARVQSVSWIDASGNLWLFGGLGFDEDSTRAKLNDLWRFDGTNWTWISGNPKVGQAGVYGTKGTPSASNVPGARNGSVSWLDLSGNRWLFGGHGHDASGSQGRLNDLWRYDGTNWTWISGDDTRNQSGTYGTKGTPSASNVPGARGSLVSWFNGGDLWLFGGNGLDAAGTLGQLGDLWRFDGTNWTWISGSNSVDQSGTYGVVGVPGASNVPGARTASVSWIDASGNLWLFGGVGFAAAGSGELNDLWRYRRP